MFDAESAGDRTVAQVLLDSSLPQLDHLFDYAIPEHLQDEVRVGQRVRVPFRSQSRGAQGYIVGFLEQSGFAGELQSLTELIGPVPVLTPEVYRLAREVADRAGGSAGDIIRLAIPGRMVRAEKQFLAHPHDGVEAGEEAADPPSSATGAASLEDSEQETVDHLLGGSRLAITASHGPVRLPSGEWVGGWALRLARLAEAVHRSGRSVILVTPDYRDLDQLRETIEALGHRDLVRVDARQSNAERYVSFLRARENRPRIILGNRSAIYAPAHDLGAVIIWDDGDPLLAEPLSPYAHARDAALIRAEASGAGLVFASHMRSVEVQRLVDIGYVLPERNPPKRTRVVHADASIVPEAWAGRVPEFAARTIREHLRKGPVLVQVASPGYAPIAACGDCGELARCTNCAGPIGFRTADRPACRWCGQVAAGWRCRVCGGRGIQQRGMGSGRTAEQFQQQFAGARVIISDGDHPHERVDSRSALVVATRGAEPIAAGGYRAVVLLDAERLLGIESLRAGEDCMRWWQNAAALAAPDGICVIASGAGPVVRAMTTGRIEQWLRSELQERRELRYPPAVRVASVIGGGREVEAAVASLGGMPGVDVLGPTPSPSRDAEPGTVRAIVRFDYAHGAEVAKRLRGALVADAAGSGSRVAGRRPGRTNPHALRLRFDDRGVFDS